ncbi:hypothetical protein EV193_10717 [Herbihabitans rhizosphaerae]|uniref:Uncharacterized protein n=1 Tax=Herbihabitans rhizosphaerae TaxID=1872711 RepID=A0A4Q7KJH9_9PSEU|nr:hypothetical protein EV193_10717 [Herbihabitans rhizosphaerae]
MCPRQDFVLRGGPRSWRLVAALEGGRHWFDRACCSASVSSEPGRSRRWRTSLPTSATNTIATKVHSIRMDRSCAIARRTRARASCVSRSSDALDTLTARLAMEFGVDADGDDTGEAAVALAWMGTQVGTDGVDYSALAPYRSPEEPDRPVMVWLNAAATPALLASRHAAIGELIRDLQDEGHPDPFEISLLAGPAVAVITEDTDDALIIDEQAHPLVERTATAWVARGVRAGRRDVRPWSHTARVRAVRPRFVILARAFGRPRSGRPSSWPVRGSGRLRTAPTVMFRCA